MNKEESLRAQAAHNIPCFIHECPLHETCLHWLTGQYHGGDFHIVTCINPYYPNVNSLQCTMYQKDDIVKYAIGMMHIFDDIPFPIARSTKKRLINLFSRKRFYEYRNGVRPIPPYEQQQIARVFQEEGWQGEIRYDGWKEDYLW
jgi:hypothetical protein